MEVECEIDPKEENNNNYVMNYDLFNNFFNFLKSTIFKEMKQIKEVQRKIIELQDNIIDEMIKHKEESVNEIIKVDKINNKIKEIDIYMKFLTKKNSNKNFEN